jgi:Na+-translocating ferredoxin:NAD+ oxidoreductase RnfD subunit
MRELRDPRTLQIIILTTFTVLGQMYLQFQVSLLQVLAAVGSSVIFELLFRIVVRKESVTFPKSAMITGLSIALLMRSDDVIPFLLAGIIGISAKFVVSYKGSHIFNPSNIGIVLVLLLFPITVATAPLQWGFYIALLFIIASAGTYMVYRVKRFPIILSFLGGFLATGLARMWIWDKTFTNIFNEFMWGGLLVFTFYMITDPKTSPESKKGQIYFGLLTALLGQTMIQLEVNGAVFLSLAIMCLVWFIWRFTNDQKGVERKAFQKNLV